VLIVITSISHAQHKRQGEGEPIPPPMSVSGPPLMVAPAIAKSHQVLPPTVVTVAPSAATLQKKKTKRQGIRS
jgi:hypothetical protein